MLVGSVVDDQLGDDPEPAPVRLPKEGLEVAQIGRTIGWMLRVVGDVVAVVLERRGIERQQPQRRDAEVLQVIELLRQPAKVADAVAVAVEEGADVKFVDDRVLVPTRVLRLRNFPIANSPCGTCSR